MSVSAEQVEAIARECGLTVTDPMVEGIPPMRILQLRRTAPGHTTVTLAQSLAYPLQTLTDSPDLIPHIARLLTAIIDHIEANLHAAFPNTPRPPVYPAHP